MPRISIGRVSGAGVLCLASLLGSCEPMQPADPAPDWGRGTWIRGVGDLTTNISSDAPIVIQTTAPYPWGEIEDWVREELPSWHASTRMVRWPSREPVEGRWVFSNDYRVLLTFEPAQPLARGWYAVQYNNSTFRVPVGYQDEATIRRSGLYWDEGWTTARFHVGSFPYVGVWGGVAVTEAGGRDQRRSYFRFYASEEVRLERDQPLADLLRVEVDGEPISCAPFADLVVIRADGLPFNGLEFNCDEVSRPGHLEVTLQPLAFLADVRYSGRGIPAVWTGRAGDPIDGRDVDESLFAAEEPEVSP